MGVIFMASYDYDGGNDKDRFARKEFNKTVLQNLNDAVAEKGISQSDLAYASRISKQTVSRYCNGSSCPTTYNLYKISVVLDKEIAYFFESHK